MRQRPTLGSFLALFTLAVASTTIACKADEGGAADTGEGKTEPAAKAEDGPAAEGEPDKSDEGTTSTTGAVDTGTSTSTTSGGELAPPEPTVDIPGLLAQAKDMKKTSDEDAIKALDEAKAAGADKIEAAKIANARGEALVADGEAERAEPFFEWAKDTHTLYAEPVFNLAKQACLAGEADSCKELLLEVKKRGNKKLLKNVGIDPIFAPVADDPDVRKLYEK
ncbi:hypothetical protein ACNOYE_00810 [Nannocystaceae bacterium ST9]